MFLGHCTFISAIKHCDDAYISVTKYTTVSRWLHLCRNLTLMPKLVLTNIFNHGMWVNMKIRITIIKCHTGSILHSISVTITLLSELNHPYYIHLPVFPLAFKMSKRPLVITEPSPSKHLVRNSRKDGWEVRKPCRCWMRER